MKISFKKRALSIFLSVLMVVSAIVPITSAFAADGVIDYYQIEIFYDETNTIVPTYQDDDETEYIIYMVEGDELQFTYQLIDTAMPDNAYITWYSETPVCVDVDDTGLVKAFDSSKGAVVQYWIDNEVATIPLIGSSLASILETALFNDYVDLDTMDTDEIIELVETAFGSSSLLSSSIESYSGTLVDSLREYLDSVNNDIHCCLYSGDGELLCEDVIHICVTKNSEWYANFLPNGTHITNKSSIDTTQAVGNTVQLSAITTPQRLGYGVVYSVKSSSIFSTGKVVATVNDDGLVTFKNTGTVTILVSPDSEDVIEGILEMVNYFYALENTGLIDTSTIATIMIDYMGLDINRTVLEGILDVAFAIIDIAEDSADAVQLTATAVEVLSNLIMQMVWNDSITFTVQEAEPITSFEISGATTVKEGAQIQLTVDSVVPTTGDTSDITWESSDPTIACVDAETGVVTGLDAGGSLGSLSSQSVTITATSAANNVVRSVTITVTGNTGSYTISSVFINGDDDVDNLETVDYTYTVYPSRVASSSNLVATWGILTGYDDDGEAVYEWCDDDNDTVSTDLAQITNDGQYTALNGGEVTIAVKVVKYVSSLQTTALSSYIATKTITNGVPVQSVTIACTGCTSNGSISSDTTVEINGETYEFITIDKGILEAYYYNGATFEATINPSNATDTTVSWVMDNDDYVLSVDDDTLTCSVHQSAAHEVADSFSIYAVSNNGQKVSNTIIVCVTRNEATDNVIDQETIVVTNGSSAEATHTMSFDGSWTGTAYACYDATWYSSDETIFTVENQGNDNSDATLYGVDVGYATLYCVSNDGGIVATCEVQVIPDKSRLDAIINLCDNSAIIRTSDNRELYLDYMGALDLAYYVSWEEEMASQTVVDTIADNLLYAFYKLGGYVGIASLEITDKNNEELESKFVTIDVGTGSYKNYSYDLNISILPKTAMYDSIVWTSSSDTISVDVNGKCTPTSNSACSAMITCTVTDYLGNEYSDSVYIAFAKYPVTAVTLNTTSIVGGKVGETQQLTATLSPTGTLGIGAASCTDLIWTSSDEDVATVDENGLITFVYGGDCVITCTTVDGGYTATCSVNVITNYDALQNLVQSYTDLQLNEANYYPDTYAEFINQMTISQTMIDENNSTQKEVDAQYEALVAAYEGLEKYTYIQYIDLYLDGSSAAEFYQYDLSLLSEGLSYTNAELDLNVRLYPNNASYSSITWESSTTDISVTSEGVCSPSSNSSCYGLISCTVEDHFGNVYTDSVWVSFAYYIVTGVVLSDTSLTGSIGDTYQLSATIQPTGTSLLKIGAASIQDYYWESDDETVATVDEDGLVTFIGAGSTIIRAVSYDGGISAECVVSTEGDRVALKEAIEKYQDIDYTLYQYEYAQIFIEALEYAQSALTDLSFTQDEIDEATENLITAAENMLDNPYTAPEDIELTYVAYKRTSLITSSTTAVESGTIDSSDALSIDLSSNYANYNSYNNVKITASASPSDSTYSSLSIETLDSYKCSVSISDDTVTVTPSSTSTGAWAQLQITVVDDYGREVTRTIYVVMSDSVCTGFDIAESSASIVTTETYTISYTISGSPEFSTIIWSSSDESVATVEDGVVTPVDIGTTTITGYTVDGGYSDSITIKVSADYDTLAYYIDTYTALVNETYGNYVYTTESLDALIEEISVASELLKAESSTQAEIDAEVEALIAAYDALEEYVFPTGISISYEEASNVTCANEGYIRYSSTLLSNKTIQLVANIEPEGASYADITWTSSNSNVTVSSSGLVTNSSSSSKWSEITATVTDELGNTYSSSVIVSFVLYGVTAVTFDDDLVYGAPGDVVTLSPNLNQSSTLISSSYISDCSYSSSDESIATVDESGNVTFISQGECTITVTSMDGGYVGTITAYTTWDSTALKSAISEASSITYTDYCYDYAMAFKDAYDAACEVAENIYASQEEIDTACYELQTAMSNLEGNEFVAPVATITVNNEEISNGLSYEIDDDGNVTIGYSLNDNAMYRSIEWSVSDVSGATYTTNSNNLIVTKTSDETASISFTLTIVDDWGETSTYSYSINIVDKIINIESISLTVNGEVVDSSYSETSLGTSYKNYTEIQMGYVVDPTDASDPVSVSWSSSASTYVTISDDGVISITTLGKLRSSNTTTITCTVTNQDGTTVSNSISITLAR